MDKNDQNQRPVESVSSNGAESPVERAQIPKPLSASDLSGQDRIDYELMQRVAINHENAVGELYDRFGSLVFRMAYQSMPTRSEAEDAVQEIFVRLWRTADRYDPRKAALVTWVMLLTRRHLVDKLRRKRARIKTAVLDDALASGVGAWIETNAGERLVNDEQFSALVKKIETLPELQQTVVVRAYLGGQTLRQISEELDTPLGTIKSALSRALVRLRERTGEETES
ncbi:MAG: RNA polymerase sigma factor [Phycisphaerales bacterium JB052]